MRRLAIPLLGSMVVAAVFLAAAAAAGRGPAPKVDVCHLTGNGSYVLIDISENAVPAHLAHGDALPGSVVGGKLLGSDCSLIATQTVRSAPLNFSSTGWGGWSCPAGTSIVSATTTLSDPAQLILWKPGATAASGATTYTYPATPFGYTYGPGEEGAIVQNGPTPESGYIDLVCTAP